MRPPRYLEARATYHATARANLQEHIFATEEIKIMFKNVLVRSKRKFKFRLKHFVIMDNHIHLLIEPIGDKYTLSDIMQWILSVFAIMFNKKYGRKGHVFYDRFKSKVVKGISYFRNVFCYISNNPVKAEMAETIFSYEYSGIYHLMRKKYHIVDKPSEEILKLFPYLKV